MIDEGLPAIWPPSAVDAVKPFRQGDLVESPPFFYAASGDCPIWSLTVRMVEDGYDASIPVLADEDAPLYGIITTQSCDLTEQPPAGRTRKPRRPWFQIAPVCPADRFSKEQVNGSLKGGQFLYLMPLRPPGLEGLWFADLRIEMPVEKGWLVGRARIPGFDDLAGYRNFAERLQYLAGRVASEGGVTDRMLDHLRAFLRKDAARGQLALESVSRIMYEEHGPELSPSLLTLHVFPVDEELPEHARKLFDDWYDDCAATCAAEGCSLQPPEYEPTASPHLFEQLVMIDMADLLPEED